MGDLSTHFSRREFDSPDGGIAAPRANLLFALERLRSICGDRPLRIVSGYRTAVYNRRVRGARSSQHIVNAAVDIPEGYATVEQAKRAGFTGIGSKGPWAIHIDVRQRPARWRY